MREAIEKERKEISYSQTKMTENTVIPKWRGANLIKSIYMYVRMIFTYLKVDVL